MKKCKYCMSEIDDKAKVCPHCGKSQKSKVSKFLGIIIAIIGAVIIISALASGGKEGKSDNLVTIENFNKIETGMTYEQVCELFGAEGTVASDVDIGEDEYKTTIYYWYDDSGIANCNVTIQGGKVIAKAQIGLD